MTKADRTIKGRLLIDNHVVAGSLHIYVVLVIKWCVNSKHPLESVHKSRLNQFEF